MLVLVRAVRVPSFMGRGVDDAAAQRPRAYCTPLHTAEYTVGTKWYAHEMLELEALDFFDFFLKVGSTLDRKQQMRYYTRIDTSCLSIPA